MRALKMVHLVDPRVEIQKAVSKTTDQIQVLGSDVLCAVYVRPEMTAGGLYLPETHGPRKEDTYQGKVGLVLRMGPLAFKDDDTHKFGDTKPKVGDWVLFRVGDTFELLIGDRKFRFVEDVNVRAIIAHPDLVY